MSSSDTSLAEDKEADVDGAERDGVEPEGGVVESVCLDLNCTLLCLMVVAFMAHMTEKWSE